MSSTSYQTTGEQHTENDPKPHAHATQKYHDGRSPSAWAFCGGASFAALIIMAGAMGPHWTIIWIGVAVFVLSAIAGIVLASRGLTNMQGRSQR